MKNGTYDCVICFSSVVGVSLRIAVRCETPWSKGHHTTPHCTLDIEIISWFV